MKIKVIEDWGKNRQKTWNRNVDQARDSGNISENQLYWVGLYCLLLFPKFD